MAAANTLRNLLEEATCPICLGPFKDPVITPCGHNFCRPCITGCFGEPGAPLCCPQCRAPCCLAELKPNRQLQSMVELVTQLAVQQEKPPLEGEVCVQHEEKLKLFCQDDNKLICLICQLSSEHKNHRVQPISEAAKEYQGKLQEWLPPLQKERDAVTVSKQKEEAEYKAMRENLEAEKMKTTVEFERLRQLLREKEQAIFKRLEEMGSKITVVKNANIAKLSNQISSLNTLIKEIETKCKQSPEELLKDVGLTLSRCENVRFREPQQKIKRNNRKDDIMARIQIKPYSCGEVPVTFCIKEELKPVYVEKARFEEKITGTIQEEYYPVYEAGVAFEEEITSTILEEEYPVHEEAVAFEEEITGTVVEEDDDSEDDDSEDDDSEDDDSEDDDSEDDGPEEDGPEEDNPEEDNPEDYPEQYNPEEDYPVHAEVAFEEVVTGTVVEEDYPEEEYPVYEEEVAFEEEITDTVVEEDYPVYEEEVAFEEEITGHILEEYYPAHEAEVAFEEEITGPIQEDYYPVNDEITTQEDYYPVNDEITIQEDYYPVYDELTVQEDYYPIYDVQEDYYPVYEDYYPEY